MVLGLFLSVNSKADIIGNKLLYNKYPFLDYQISNLVPSAMCLGPGFNNPTS